MDDTTKYAIISRLQLKHDTRLIAEEVGVSHASVVRLQTKYEDAVLNNTVNKLVDMDKLMVQELTDKYPIDEVNNLVNSIDGLDLLNKELQDTAVKLISKTRALLVSASTTDELLDVSKVICEIQVAFFNKNSTQVNVQNNLIGGEKASGNPYSSFLGDTIRQVV